MVPPASPPAPVTRQALVRGRYMQTFVAHIARLPPADRSAVLAVVPAEIWTAIEKAGLLGWLPFEMNRVCTRAVGERLGPERTNDFFRQLLLGTADGPLLRGLVQSVLRVTVRDPGLYLPWLPKGWAVMFRDAGHMSVGERDAGSALVSIDGLPAECVSDEIWIQSVASSLAALGELAGVESSVRVKSVDAASRSVNFALRWALR
jgi:hypothetical protein